MSFRINDGISDSASNELYKFMIVSTPKRNGKVEVSVEGHMQNELSIGGQNGFTDVSAVISEVADIAGGISKTLASVVGIAGAIKRGLNAANQAASQSKVTDVESRLIWEGSEKPQFQIDYTFYNTSWEYSETTKGALSQALTLQKTVLPSKGAPAKNRPGVFFRSPLGYKPKTGGNKVAQGTLTLSIGKWFRANDLVVRSTNFTPSKQVLKNGHPVLVKGTITLEPSELITYETFLGYFKKVTTNTSANEKLGSLF